MIVFFGFYSGDCFDRVIVLFTSRICVCECPVRIHCPWQRLFSVDVVSLSLSLSLSRPHPTSLSLQEYILCVYESLSFHPSLCSPLLLGSPNCIQRLHRADMCTSLLVCPWVKVHRRTSLMSSSLLLQQCPGFIFLGWFRRLEININIPAILWGLPTKIVQKSAYHSCAVYV